MRAHDTLGFSKTLFNDSVTWTTSNSLIASLGDDPPTSFSQEIQAVAVGTAFLTAQWDAFADIVQITVAPESVRIESFLATSFVSWYDGNYNRAPGIALSTLADEHTASWGNFGMKDLSSEPRQAFNNDPSYTYSYVADWPWNHMYDALLCLRDAILGLGVAAEVSGGGPSPSSAAIDIAGLNADAVRAYGAFVQALSTGTLGLLFDKAFVIDETTDLNAPNSLSRMAR